MSRLARRARAVSALLVWALSLGTAAFAAPPPKATKPATSKPAGKPATAKPKPPVPKPAGKPATAKPKSPVVESKPLRPLSIFPSIARVNVTSHGKMISVVTEVNLPRGEWSGEPLRFHVAFGAPGPRAIDARLIRVKDGSLEPEEHDAGESLTIEQVARRPPSAHPLLGRETMAGVVVDIPSSSLSRAFVDGSMASLRIRSLVETTEPDATGAISVLVRLGASRGNPLTLGRITATSAEDVAPLARVEAKLCGPDADPFPLAVAVSPKPPQVGEHQPVIAPVLSVRHTTDDLCVRLWHVPSKEP